MTWPFENDTSAIVKKLAKRYLKTDKSRNILIIIIITIALAACLLMATTLYFFAFQRKSLNDAAGRYQAVIDEVDDDTLTKLVNDDRLVLFLSVSFGTLMGYLLCTVFSAMSVFGKVSYHFLIFEMFSFFLWMLAVQMLFSYSTVRQIKKQSLVHQIRELS